MTVYPILEGKTVIVTGSGSGMGSATAKLFAEARANVVVVDMNVEGGETVVHEITEKGGKAIFVKTNISDGNAVKNMVAKAVEAFGSVDAAINNAGIELVVGETMEYDEDAFNKQIQVNLVGTALCMKHEMAQMKAQGTGGAIVNLGSCCTNKAYGEMLGYTASKWGVRGMTQVAAVDGGKYGIRVNSICPGTVLTPMVERYYESNGLDPAEDAKLHTSIGRYAQPVEIAQVSMFLISDAASYISGANLNIDVCESLL